MCGGAPQAHGSLVAKSKTMLILKPPQRAISTKWLMAESIFQMMALYTFGGFGDEPEEAILSVSLITIC